MVWNPETSCGFESAKIAAFAVPYLQGIGVDIGCGMQPVWPSAIPVDNGHHFGDRSAGIRKDGRDLSIFADGSLDYVFSSHVLEHFPREDVPGILREWTRVLKVGGHLVLYVPSANLYPRCGEPGANPDHKWDIETGDVERLLKAMTADRICGWDLLESEERAETNEYSFFIVVRKTTGWWDEKVWQRNPGGKKRALIIRYGAIGDQIMAASIIPGLREQGYHVTYSTTPDAAEVLKHDPHIDDWFIQAKDFVPNAQLGPFWDTLGSRYDRVINLCESIEGGLLQMPGRLQHQYPDAARRALYSGVNYLERTHDIADVPHKFAARFYPSDDEKVAAIRSIGAFDGPVVAWAVTGSADHKTYPWTNVVAKWLVERTDAHVVLMGAGANVKTLEKAIISTVGPIAKGRIHGRVNAWGVRESLAFVQYADVVVGPETGLLNAVGMATNAKVVYLSHSSAENLTKHWVNTTTLEPDLSRAPCFPCHRLHFGFEFCHMNEETHAAACASAVSPDRVFQAIVTALRASMKVAA